MRKGIETVAAVIRPHSTVADPAERQRLGNAGRERLREAFDERVMVARIDRVYEELAATRSRLRLSAPM